MEKMFACYSQKQKAVHIESEQELLDENLTAIFKGREIDFIPFYSGDYKNCCWACEILKKNLATIEKMKNSKEAILNA